MTSENSKTSAVQFNVGETVYVSHVDLDDAEAWVAAGTVAEFETFPETDVAPAHVRVVVRVDGVKAGRMEAYGRTLEDLHEGSNCYPTARDAWEATMTRCGEIATRWASAAAAICDKVHADGAAMTPAVLDCDKTMEDFLATADIEQHTAMVNAATVAFHMAVQVAQARQG